MAHLQKELLLSAIDSVDANSKASGCLSALTAPRPSLTRCLICAQTGGIVIYSTCSVAVEENEQARGAVHVHIAVHITLGVCM